MVVRVTKLGGTASEVTVGRISHGLMMATCVLLPPLQGRVAIRAGVDALPAGVKMVFEQRYAPAIHREFYSATWGTENLELLARFYAKYPEYAEKTFLSVKGGMNAREPDSSLEYLRKSVTNIARALGPHKTMDLYEPARIDPGRSIEEAMANLVVLRDEGHFAHIGLSECKAETLRRAHAVSPVTAVEIELSVWEYGEEQKKFIVTAGELGISVIAYSPLGKGFLTRKFVSPKDLPAGDYRTRFTRFTEANMVNNMPIVSTLTALAAKKGVTPAQLAIAWVAALGEHVIPLPGSSRAARTLENCAAGDIELSADEFAEVTALADADTVVGDRMAGGKELQHLWG
ncbi:aldo/keto reductase [Mycena rosella]|uniref:Aldo/keto reductase n=1 Tax=Mycena rosella TaxID=1033263 RepID=A0AAD7CUG7_MYCRO|nr:aldo/keto reductase [Mycena rosella]